MATAQADIHVKVDQNIKSESENILGQIGISMSDLINMTLRRVIREKRIPFDTSIAEKTPDCMRIISEKQLKDYLEKGAEYDAKNPNTYTTEEIEKILGITA
ncbi:type II toxin-antitoxin system RelB/DinJ family antitoxin [Candidatus Saccharibacteria bacterium]|nr:type II toxin-antitoxin system RelB/DinJ family antitoxin [Candidatus Saccharibacteria bacterium]